MTGMEEPDLERIIEDADVRESSNEDSAIQLCQEDEDKEHKDETQQLDVEQDLAISQTESPKEGAVKRDIFKENDVEIDLSNEETDSTEQKEPLNQDYVPLKDNNEVTNTPEKDISYLPSHDNDLIDEPSKLETSMSPINKDNKGINDVTHVARTKEVSEEKNISRDNNVVTVELDLKNEQNIPEIVIDPKFVKRPYNGKIASQKIRAVSKRSSYRPVSSEIKLKSQPSKSNSPLQNSKKYSFCTAFKCWFLFTLFTAFVGGYAVGGAYLFSHLEKEREISYNNKIEKWKNDTAILLATELRQVKPYEEVWARKIFHHLEIYEKDLLKASAIGYRREDHKDRGQKWTWSSSLFFSISLMTTTGYGPMTPRSKLGRLAAVFYSLLGIPLTFSWFMTIGYMLATNWLTLFKNLCCRLCDETSSDTVLVTTLPSTSNEEYVKLLRMRSNSIVPEEEKLIAKTDTRLKNSGKICRKVFPENLRDEFTPKNNHLVKNEIIHQKRIIKTESELFEGVYHTMDYALAIIYAFLFFFNYFIICSVFFAVYEQWILTDVLYISYLFFTTLGPGCHELEDDGAEINIKNNLFYTVHLCIGYCILAMIVNLIYMMLHRKNVPKKEERQDFDSIHREKF